MKLVSEISRILVLILAIYFVYSCKKDESEPLSPRIKTTSVTLVSATSAVIGGILTDVGSTPLLNMGICWSTSPEPTFADNVTTESLTDISFSSTLTLLIPNTKYYARAYAKNKKGTGYGNQISFTTGNIAVPTLTTNDISQFTSTSATSGGNITTDNGGLVTARGVCWGTTQNPTVDDCKTIDGEGTGKFISSIVGLRPSTLYYVRAYATNSAGTAYGNQLTLQTPFDILLTKENSILTGGKIMPTRDGGHVIFGYIYKADIPPTQVRDWIPYLIKLDSFGNRIWETEISLSMVTNYLYSDILETKDGKIVFCYKSYVVMLDENGNVLWKFDYKMDDRYGCSSLVESDENNLIILSSNELRTMLLRISMEGELISEKLLKDGDDVNYNCGHLLCKLDNGNYFLAGYSNINLHWRIWVAEINSIGDISWEKNFIDSYELSRCTDMVKTKDGGVIITGYSMGERNITYARVMKIDSKHELAWEKSYSWDSFSNYITAIIQDFNGDYVLCGIQGYQQVRAILVKLKNNGDEIWKRTYWPNDDVDFRWYFGSVLQNSNGGYMLVGYQSTLWGEAMPKGIWVKKVDQSGY
jgi:hypothetical protein